VSAYDLLITGGQVVDGSGRSASVADIAIRDGRIAEIGTRLSGVAKQTLDADGAIVTPGFIDIHTHYDAQVTWDERLAPSAWHGVTTAVIGNCGVGFAPVSKADRKWAVQLMEGVEDIPADVLLAGIDWQWETFPEYLGALDRRRWNMNIAAQVPHAALRAWVMRERAGEKATEGEISAMAAAVAEAIAVGAFGLSVTRTTTHLTAEGKPVPGTTASREELLALGLALGEGMVFEAIFHGAGGEAEGAQLRELEMFAEVVAAAKCRLLFTLFQTDQYPDEWRQLLRRCEAGMRQGLSLHPQVACRPFGLLVGLGTTHPFRRRPTYRTLASLPLAERAAAMRKPEIRERILGEVPVDANPRAAVFPFRWDQLFVIDDWTNCEPTADQSVLHRAAAAERDPEDFLYDLLVQGDGTAFLLRTLLGYSDFSLEPVREMLIHPSTYLGLSDAGAHCRIMCDAGASTTLLAYWVRDRQAGERLRLEEAVRSLTSAPAELYGFHERGLLAPGYHADINIIDMDRLGLHAPFVAADLPAGGERLLQRASGYVATIVGGEPVLLHDEFTGATPGRLLRHAASRSQVPR
jgi:N-acyl-D-amino-acid deacylase